MNYETILMKIEAGVATVTLNRPEVKNGLNAQMRLELGHAVRTASEEARVLVLTGAGDAFCSGQDLGDAAGLIGQDLGRVLREEYEPLLRLIIDCPIPTISAVRGAAAGAGANLALSADVVIAAESAVFVQAFTRIGLIPDAGGTYWLPRLVGMPRAMGAALFAEPVPARQAAEWGMIWQAVPDAEFDEVIRHRASQLATGPTFAYARVKEALHLGAAADFETQLETEARLQGECGASRDFREGVLAFTEKRPARFEGR